jgi:hypothetical protein
LQSDALDVITRAVPLTKGVPMTEVRIIADFPVNKDGTLQQNWNLTIGRRGIRTYGRRQWRFFACYGKQAHAQLFRNSDGRLVLEEVGHCDGSCNRALVISPDVEEKIIEYIEQLKPNK